MSASSTVSAPSPPLGRISLSVSRISRRFSRRPAPQAPVAEEYEAGRKSDCSVSTYSGESYKEYERLSDMDDTSFVTDVPTPHPHTFAEEWPASDHGSASSSSDTLQTSAFDPASVNVWPSCCEMGGEKSCQRPEEGVNGLQPSSMQAAGCLQPSRFMPSVVSAGGNIPKRGSLFKMQRVSDGTACSGLPKVFLPGNEDRVRGGFERMKIEFASMGRDKWAKAVVAATCGEGLPTEGELKKIIEGIEEGGSAGDKSGACGAVWTELKKRLRTGKGLVVVHVILRTGRPQFVEYLSRIGGGLEGLEGGYVRYLRMWLRMKGEVHVPNDRICGKVGEISGSVEQVIWRVGVVLDVVEVAVGVHGWGVDETISRIVGKEIRIWMGVAGRGVDALVGEWRGMESRLRVRAMRVYARFAKVGEEVERVLEDWKLEEAWRGEGKSLLEGRGSETPWNSKNGVRLARLSARERTGKEKILRRGGEMSLLGPNEEQPRTPKDWGKVLDEEGRVREKAKKSLGAQPRTPRDWGNIMPSQFNTPLQLWEREQGLLE